MPGGRGRAQSRGAGRRVALLVTALLLQLAVLGLTASLGLIWYGPTYIAALLTAALGLGVVPWVARRRAVAALVVPLVSLLLTFGLLWVGDLMARQTECSPAERAAFAELAPPPGATVELRGEMANGCIARFDTSLSGPEVAAHYEREFTAHGWQSVQSERATAATKSGVVVRVERFDRAKGGESLVIVTVSDR